MMSRQTISSPSPPSDEPNIETLDAQRNGRDVAARRQTPRARSTSRPPRTDSPPARSPTPSDAGRPHGHIVGHGPGEPPPPSFAGRPHGHVVGHPVDNAPPLPKRAGYQKAA